MKQICHKLMPEFQRRTNNARATPKYRLIKQKLVIARYIFNIVSTHAPHMEETEKIKEEFLKDWEDLMSIVSRTEKTVVGAELNGHVGNNPGVFRKCSEKKAMARRKEKGRQS